MLTRYKAWAFDATVKAVSEIPKNELTGAQERTYSTIIDSLNHILTIDDFFKAQLERKTQHHLPRNAELLPPLYELSRASEAMDQWYIDLADRLSKEELAELIEINLVSGEKCGMTHAEILLHVVNHARYRIVLVNDMIYQFSARPLENDLTDFLREVWQRQC